MILLIKLTDVHESLENFNTILCNARKDEGPRACSHLVFTGTRVSHIPWCHDQINTCVKFLFKSDGY